MSAESLKTLDSIRPLVEDSDMVLQDSHLHAEQEDVNFFENQLNLAPDPLSKDITAGANSLSQSLAEKKHAFEAALTKASNTADPTDILAAARSLSEYSIQTSIVAKAAGKSSQAVDKMTNLN